MFIWILLQQIYHSLKSHRLRSFLAMFGIMWGTISVVLLLALGNGYYTAMEKHMSSLSSGLITLFPYKTSIPYKGEPSGRSIHIRINDVLALQQSIKDIKLISPVFKGLHNAVIRYNNISTHNKIEGVSPDYLKLQHSKMQPGSRFINPIDLAEHKYVTFIGYQLKHSLFKSQSAIGKTIYLSGIPFTVIGILSKKASGSFTTFWDKLNAFIPYSTYLAIYGNQDVSNLLILPRHANQSVKLAAAIKLFLANRFSFSPQDKTAVQIPDFAKVTNFFNWFFFAIRTFLAFAGIMTLGVGGVGVANIMYLIVNERTPEICLRMALGARDFHVISQILIEAFIIIFVGGIAGVLIASTIVGLLDVAHLPSWMGKPFVSTDSIIITFSILAIVAILSGWFPAVKAANTHPAEALH